MADLKGIRESKRLTQKEAAALLGVSLRSYITYENDETKIDSLKYNYMAEALQKVVTLDEEHGVLTLQTIQQTCASVLDGYNVRYAILFGSYAKGIASEKSDVDLLVSSDVSGLRFFGLAERLRTELKKKVDLLDVKQVQKNPLLLDDILKDGIRIYG